MPRHELGEHFQRQLAASLRKTQGAPQQAYGPRVAAALPTYRSVDSPLICDCCGSVLQTDGIQYQRDVVPQNSSCIRDCYAKYWRNPGPCLANKCGEWSRFDCGVSDSTECADRCSEVKDYIDRRNCLAACAGALALACRITLPRTYNEGAGHPIGAIFFLWRQTTPIGGVVDFSSIWPTGAETLTLSLFDFVAAWNRFKSGLVPAIRLRPANTLELAPILAGPPTSVERLLISEPSRPWLSAMGFRSDLIFTHRPLIASNLPTP